MYFPNGTTKKFSIPSEFPLGRKGDSLIPFYVGNISYLLMKREEKGGKKTQGSDGEPTEVSFWKTKSDALRGRGCEPRGQVG